MLTTASAIDLPFKEAIDFFRQKDNIPSEHWTAVMDEAHSRGFAVAGATKEAMIQDFREAIDKALAKGTTFQEFRGDFDTIVQKYGWSHTGTADWRAKVIYNTNLSTAFSAGRYAQATDPAVLAAFPYWQYQHINCPNPRLQHIAWSGMVLRADDPWWDAHYPPNGWGCHCQVFIVNDRGLARMGKTPDQLKAPPVQWMTYEDPTTGRVTRHPAGVDPGFAYNPGKAWKDGVKPPLRAPSARPTGSVPPVLAQPGETSVPPAVLKAFLEAPGDVGVQITTIGSGRVVLSGDAVKAAGSQLDQAAIAEIAAALNAGAAARPPGGESATVTHGGWTILLRRQAAGVWEISKAEKT